MTFRKTLWMNYKTKSHTEVQNISHHLFKCKMVPSFNTPPPTETSRNVGPPLGQVLIPPPHLLKGKHTMGKHLGNLERCYSLSYLLYLKRRKASPFLLLT